MLALRLSHHLSGRAASPLLTSSLRRSLWHDVRSSGIKLVSAPIARNQKLEKTWALSGARPLDKLKLSSPGLAYISVVDDLPQFAREHGVDSSSSLVAVVRATSNSSEALERVSVASKFPYRTQIGFDGVPMGMNASSSLSEAHLLTEIVLPRSSLLRRLAFSQAGDVVVDGSALATIERARNSSVRLAASANRQVFVTASSAAMDRIGLSFWDLKVTTWMGAQVRVVAPRISAQGQVSVASAGAGAGVTFDTGAFTADRVSVDVAGGGEAVVVADELTLGYLRTRIGGGGNVALKQKTPTSDPNVDVKASCECQEIDIAGDGSVDASDLATLMTRVRIAGRGDAAVRASELLTVKSAGDAAVSYSGPKPRIVQTFGVPLTVEQHDRASSKASSIAEAGDVPTKASAFDAESKLVVDVPWYGHHYRSWWCPPRGFDRHYGHECRRFGWHRQRRWSRWGDSTGYY